MTCVIRAGARPLSASFARLLPRLGALLLVTSGSVGCYGSSTADEALLYDPEDFEDSADGGTRDGSTDGGKSDGGPTDDPCADIDPADIFGQITCDFTNNANGEGALGGGLGDILGLLGGGGNSDDPIGGALDLLNLLELVGGLTGGGGQSGGLGDLLGLLGGGQSSSDGGLGDLLGLLGGGAQQSTPESGIAIGDLLDLLGGLQASRAAQAEQPESPR